MSISKGIARLFPCPCHVRNKSTPTHTSALHTISCFLSTPNPKICLSQDLQNCAMHKTDNSMKSPIDICWNVGKELRMDSPIHTQYLCSGGATTLTWQMGPGQSTPLLSCAHQCLQTTVLTREPRCWTLDSSNPSGAHKFFSACKLQFNS